MRRSGPAYATTPLEPRHSGPVLQWHAVFVLVWVVTSLWLATALHADQRESELPALFEQLLEADSARTAGEIEAKIWQAWLSSEDTRAAALMRQLTAEMGSGNLEEALLVCNELVEHAPKFAEAWNKRATVYYLMGDFNASVEDIQRTLILEPRHFGAISGLGLIFFRQGNLSAALEAFEQVASISPQSLNAKRSIEQVRKQLGDEI